MSRSNIERVNTKIVRSFKLELLTGNTSTHARDTERALSIPLYSHSKVRLHTLIRENQTTLTSSVVSRIKVCFSIVQNEKTHWHILTQLMHMFANGRHLRSLTNVFQNVMDKLISNSNSHSSWFHLSGTYDGTTNNSFGAGAHYVADNICIH